LYTWWVCFVAKSFVKVKVAEDIEKKRKKALGTYCAS
jgi:hypothetical protein